MPSSRERDELLRQAALATDDAPSCAP